MSSELIKYIRLILRHRHEKRKQKEIRVYFSWIMYLFVKHKIYVNYAVGLGPTIVRNNMLSLWTTIW